LKDNVFNELPLLLAVPRAAQLLGITRAATYRLVASGELPARRLGGRVYVVTAALRDLVHREQLCLPVCFAVVFKSRA
jgi:excisionase family DNA binding protein